MKDKLYYHLYEERYKTVYAAGAGHWGTEAKDEILGGALADWVARNALKGKNIIEYACGEGASGVMLSRLGCKYHGVDIAPSALQKAKEALREFPFASVFHMDMVQDRTASKYDAALDVMGLHMLVTDEDRLKYLKNAYASLKHGAPMLFFRESYRRDIEEMQVASFDQWVNFTNFDGQTPEKRYAFEDGRKTEVWIPLLPARARSKEGYISEMRSAGFEVDDFIEMNVNEQIAYSSAIYVHKP